MSVIKDCPWITDKDLVLFLSYPHMGICNSPGTFETVGPMASRSLLRDMKTTSRFGKPRFNCVYVMLCNKTEVVADLIPRLCYYDVTAFEL